MPEWRWGLTLPLPLFVLDEVIYAVSRVAYFAGKRIGEPVLADIPIKNIAQGLEELWYALRKEGAYTLVEVCADDVRLTLRFI
jgi:hypothetical protein